MAASIYKPLYQYQFTSRMHDIDAAGVMFFGRFFYHLHDAYESFLNSHEQSIAQLLNSDFHFPISHSEMDFKSPIILNEIITIDLSLDKIETDKFILHYQFRDSSGISKATANTHHVCLDASSKQRTPVPDKLLRILTMNND